MVVLLDRETATVENHFYSAIRKRGSIPRWPFSKGSAPYEVSTRGVFQRVTGLKSWPSY